MATKDEILEEIRRLTTQLGATPGRRVFEKESGIRESEWYGVYWSRWNDAELEAGVATNQKNEKLPVDYVMNQYASAVRKFGRIPVAAELRMFSREVENFPNETTLSRHFGNKLGLVAAFSEWVRNQPEHTDLLSVLPAIASTSMPKKDEATEGSVYLLRSGDHYKIGRSDQLELRMKQIAISLPEKVKLEHAIRTDDPAGIEAYWHRRFAEKRLNGEWFRLSSADVRAFKRRRFQ
jgi:hypothetical protein